jgi:hypothetical protein
MIGNPPGMLGVRLTLCLGQAVTSPAPAALVEALQNVEVELGDEGNDGFQLVFGAGRKPGVLTADSTVFAHPLLRPFSRVAVQVSIGPQYAVLIDGFITHREAFPGNEPGSSILTVTGEDVRVMMDLQERTVSHLGLSADMRVQRILSSYQKYLGSPPQVMPPNDRRTPSPVEEIPVQSGTDLAYMRRLARDNAYVFYVEPAGVPNVNLAYWGPPPRNSQPQAALSVDMGPASNAAIRFSYDALKPETIVGMAMDKKTRNIQAIDVQATIGSPLAIEAASEYQGGVIRKRLARQHLGGDAIGAQDGAQAAADRSANGLVAEADIDVAKYGGLLRPRRLVGVRGAGQQLDGLYYVKRVIHSIRRGEYRQRCRLTREGVGTTITMVPT